MTRKVSKRSSSDENIEKNFANYLKRKSLLHQQPTPPQVRPHFWTAISNQVWNLVAKTFKKEARSNENDLFNEACAARLAGLRNSQIRRTRRELDFLCRKTKFTRHEIKLLYLGWKDVCVNGYLNESTCKDIYAQFFPQASDSSLYARHVYRALFSRNNILTNLNNNNILTSNANTNTSNDQLLGESTQAPSENLSPLSESKKFRQQMNRKFGNQEDQCCEQTYKSRTRSQSTAGFFKSKSSTNPQQQLQQQPPPPQTSSSNTPGLLLKRHRAQSLAKQTIESSSSTSNCYMTDNLIPINQKNPNRSSNSNLSVIHDEVYFDYPLRRSSRNASTATLSYRDTVPERISFVEYAISLSALLKGSLEEKLAWTFQLYDVSGDGKLTSDDLIEISRAVYALLGYYVQPAHDSITYVEHGKKVFEKMDVNKTGYVNLEQFIDCCLKDESITKSLQLITACPF